MFFILKKHFQVADLFKNEKRSKNTKNCAINGRNRLGVVSQHTCVTIDNNIYNRYGRSLNMSRTETNELHARTTEINN